MYLAADRVLCFELLARTNCRWTMHYVKVTALQRLSTTALYPTALSRGYRTALSNGSL
jgi:hypothetical protein